MTEDRKAVPDDRVLRLINAALDLQAAGDLEGAQRVLLRAQALEPEYAPVHVMLGIIYRDTGVPEAAEARFRRALELDVTNVDALQSLGLLLIEHGQSEEGLGYLEQHLGRIPGDPVTLAALSRELHRVKRSDEGLRLLMEAWQSTRRPDVGLLLGRYLVKLQKPQQAETIFLEVVAQEESPEVLTLLAVLALRRNQPGDAVERLRRALEHKPDHVPAWRGLTEAYLLLDQPDQALASAERLLTLDNRDCRHWLSRVNALLALKRHDEALESARTGLECAGSGEPERPVVVELLHLQEAQALTRLGKRDEALQVLIQARRTTPRSQLLARVQVRILIDAGRPEEALRVIEESAEGGAPEDGLLAPLRYEALHLLGKSEAAWNFIKPMLAADSERRLNVLGGIGVNLYVLGEVPASRAVFEQLVAYAPDLPRASCCLGFVLTGEGDLDGAKLLFETALQGQPDKELRATLLADLGYVHLVSGNLVLSEQSLQEALAIAGEGDEAILRIAYWRDGHVIPDPVRHPTSFIRERSAGLANLVTLELARAQTAEAEAIARKLLDEAPESAVGYKSLGTVMAASDQGGQARTLWQEALHRSQDEQERALLSAWLDEQTTP